MLTDNIRLSIACIVLAMSLTAGLIAGDEVYSITRSNELRNTYAVLQNNHIATTIFFVVGEFELRRGAIVTALPFAVDAYRRRREVSRSRDGVDPSLSGKYISAPFIPRMGDTLSFYRAASVASFEQLYRQGGQNRPPDTFGLLPHNWKTAVDDVHDTTAVIIRVEDVADPTVYTDIDSMIVYANPTDSIVPHEGSEPDLFEHRRLVASELAGRTVRLRLIFRRHGRGVYGPTADFELPEIAYSAYRCPWAPSKLDAASDAALRQRYQDLMDAHTNAANVEIDSLEQAIADYEHDMWMYHSDTTNYYIVTDSVDATLRHYYPKQHVYDTINARRQANARLRSGKNTDQALAISVKQRYVFSKARDGSDSIVSTDEKDLTPTERAETAKRDLSMKVSVIDAFGGSLRVTINAPEWMTDLTWEISDMKGQLLGSGLIWPEFKGPGKVTIPYLPIPLKPCTLKLIDNQKGTMIAKQIRS